MNIRSNGFRLIVISEVLERKIFLFLANAIAVSIPFLAIINSISSIILLAFWLFFMRKDFDGQRLKILLAISSIFWIALVGMAYTQNVDEGLFRLQQKALLFILPLTFGTVQLHWQHDPKQIISFFVVGIVAACLVCLTNATWYWAQHQSTERFFSHGLVHFIDLYPYVLSLSCLVSVLVLWQAHQGKIELHPYLQKPQVIISLLLFLSGFIMLLEVKQIIIAWTLCLISFLTQRFHTKKIVLTTLIVGLIAVAISVTTIPAMLTKANDIISWRKTAVPEHETLTKIWNGITMRRAVWSCALDLISENFWVGVGTGDGQDNLQQAYERNGFIIASRYNQFNTHNQYLQTLVNFGMVGLVLWLAALVWLFKSNLHNPLLIYALCCVLFSMLTESMLETNKGALTMAFVLTVFSFGLPAQKHN